MFNDLLRGQVTPHSLLVKTSHQFERFSAYLPIFGLAGGTIINVLLFYLGIHGTGIRSKLYILAAVVVFCLACLRFLQIYMTTPNDRRRIFLALIYPACGIFIFGGAFVMFGTGAYRSVNLLLQFGCFCIPAFIFGLDCALKHRESILFKTIDIIFALYIPFAVYGIYTMFTPSNISGSLAMIGELNYMIVAYTILLPISFMVTSIVLLPNSRFFIKTIDSKTSSTMALQVIRTGLALLFWYVILCTGTRGTMVCVFGLFVFLLLWTVYTRNKRQFIRSFIVFLLFLTLFVLFIFVIKSPLTSGSVNRVNLFVDKLMEGSFHTSNTRAVSKDDLHKIKDMPVKVNMNEKKEVADDTETLDPVKVVMNREQLFYAAIEEFKKSPVFGIGPLGFYIKYDRNVHNAILEVLCEYGIVGSLLIFGVILVLLTRLMKSAKNSVIDSAMLAILVCLQLPLLVSYSFIGLPAFWFFLGYASFKGKRSILNN